VAFGRSLMAAAAATLALQSQCTWVDRFDLDQAAPQLVGPAELRSRRLRQVAVHGLAVDNGPTGHGAAGWRHGGSGLSAGQRARSAAVTMTVAPCWVNLPSSRTRRTITSGVVAPVRTASQVRPAQL
jgi:hypothetical protein